MRDVYQVIHQKELDILRVRQEIEALRASLPLLADDDDADDIPIDSATYSPLRAVHSD